MQRNPLTGEWAFLPIELWQEKDHQSHVAEQQRAILERTAKRIPALLRAPDCPTRPAYRNPTRAEDPQAYMGD